MVAGMAMLWEEKIMIWKLAKFETPQYAWWRDIKYLATTDVDGTDCTNVRTLIFDKLSFARHYVTVAK